MNFRIPKALTVRAFCALLLAAAIPVAQAQGIPVFDAQALAQQAQQVASWLKQIQGMRDQLDQQKQLFGALNGATGIGRLLNNPALRSALPTEWQKVYREVQSGGYAGLTGAAKAIRDANRIYECGLGRSTEQARCAREMSKAAQDKAFASDAYAAADLRLDNIQALMSQIDAATDAKQIADLQVRMQAEQAMIQNEQIKLSMFRMMADAEDRLIAQQKHEQDLKDYADRRRSANTWVPPRF